MIPDTVNKLANAYTPTYESMEVRWKISLHKCLTADSDEEKNYVLHERAEYGGRV